MVTLSTKHNKPTCWKYMSVVIVKNSTEYIRSVLSFHNYWILSSIDTFLHIPYNNATIITTLEMKEVKQPIKYPILNILKFKSKQCPHFAHPCYISDLLCIVQFQKISILPSQKGLEFPGGGGTVRPKYLKKCVKLNWNFQRGGVGGLRKKNPFCGGGMDVFRNYTFSVSSSTITMNICQLL